MSIGIGQRIEVLDYTSIWSKLESLFASYGSNMTSSGTPPDDTITADLWNKLRDDLIKISNHQNDRVIADGITNDLYNLYKPAVNVIISDDFRRQYDDFVSNLLLHRHDATNSELKINTLSEATRVVPWNGIIAQTMTISVSELAASSSYTSAQNLEFFFNTGGSIKITSSRSDFDTTRPYDPGNKVRYRGRYYTVTQSTTGNIPPNELYFTPLEYSDQKSYHTGDIVHYKNDIYNNYHEAIHNSTIGESPIGSANFKPYKFSTTIPAYIRGNESPKNKSWTDLLDAIGTISLNYNQTSNTGSIGVGFNIGFDNLTEEDQVLFLAQVGTGPYASNYYKLIGHVNSTRDKIYLTAYFVDDANESPVDLNISGELTCIVDECRSDGRIIGPPLAIKQAGLDATLPGMVYSIIPDKTAVSEGDVVKFTIITNDTPPTPNTTKNLYWKVIGSATTVDFADGQIFGSIPIDQSGVYVLSRTMTKDDLSESSKQFQIQLLTGSINGTAVKLSSKVKLNDILTYSISTVTNEVNEGGTASFNIASNSPDGTVLYWKTVGNTTVNDFDDGMLSGTVTIINKSARLYRKTKLDHTTDGQKQFKIDLLINALDGKLVDSSDPVIINDTSKTVPILAISPVKTEVTEGDTVEFKITGGTPNQSIFWTTKGTTSPTDFPDGDTGSITLNAAGTGSLLRTIVADTALEPVEYFAIQLRPKSIIGSVAVTSSNVRITDKTSTSIKLQPNVSSIGEGGSVLFNITSNLPEGVLIFWSTKGTVDVYDFDDNLISGAAITDSSGSAVVVRSIKADKKTEAGEQFQLIAGVSTGAYVFESGMVTIEDTSKSYYTYSIVSNTTVKEGGTIDFTINSSDVTSPELYWTMSGNSESTDFIDGQSNGRVSLSASGSGVITRKLSSKVPQTTTSKYFQIQLRRKSFVDSVLAYSPRVAIQSAAAVEISSTIQDVYEGKSVDFVISSNLPTNTILYWHVDYEQSTVDSDDFYNGIDAGIITLIGGAGKLSLTLVDDITNENAESFVVVLTTGSHSGPVIATSNKVTVLDTPRGSFTYGVKIYNAANKESYQFYEGDVMKAIVTTPDDSTGTTKLYWSLIDKKGIIREDFVVDETDPGYILVGKDGIGIFSGQLASDGTSEGVESFKVQFRTDSQTGKIVATSYDIIVMDTSRSSATYTTDVLNYVQVSSTNDVTRDVILHVENGIDGTVYNWAIAHGELDATGNVINKTRYTDFVKMNGTFSELKDGMASATVTIKKNANAGSGQKFRVDVKDKDTTVHTTDPIELTLTAGAQLYEYTLVADRSDKTYKEAEIITMTLTATPLASGTVPATGEYGIGCVAVNSSEFSNLNYLYESKSVTMKDGTATFRFAGAFKSTYITESMMLSFQTYKTNNASTILATLPNVKLLNIADPTTVYKLTTTKPSYKSGDAIELLIQSLPIDTNKTEFTITLAQDDISVFLITPTGGTTTTQALNSEGISKFTAMVSYVNNYTGTQKSLTVSAVRKSDGKVMHTIDIPIALPTTTTIPVTPTPTPTPPGSLSVFEIAHLPEKSIGNITASPEKTKVLLPAKTYYGLFESFGLQGAYSVSPNNKISIFNISGNFPQYIDKITFDQYSYVIPPSVTGEIRIYYKPNTAIEDSGSFKIVAAFDNGNIYISNTISYTPESGGGGGGGGSATDINITSSGDIMLNMASNPTTGKNSPTITTISFTVPSSYASSRISCGIFKGAGSTVSYAVSTTDVSSTSANITLSWLPDLPIPTQPEIRIWSKPDYSDITIKPINLHFLDTASSFSRNTPDCSVRLVSEFGFDNVNTFEQLKFNLDFSGKTLVGATSFSFTNIDVTKISHYQHVPWPAFTQLAPDGAVTVKVSMPSQNNALIYYNTATYLGDGKTGISTISQPVIPRPPTNVTISVPRIILVGEVVTVSVANAHKYDISFTYASTQESISSEKYDGNTAVTISTIAAGHYVIAAYDTYGSTVGQTAGDVVQYFAAAFEATTYAAGESPVFSKSITATITQIHLGGLHKWCKLAFFVKSVDPEVRNRTIYANIPALGSTPMGYDYTSSDDFGSFTVFSTVVDLLGVPPGTYNISIDSYANFDITIT